LLDRNALDIFKTLVKFPNNFLAKVLWVQKITIATLKNRLSLNFTLWNIESVAISIQKTIAAHAWVHQPF
jgi:hypothetical protein